MGSNVFLVPCDPGNFERTVRSEIDVSEYPSSPDPISGKDTVRFWGASDGDGNQSYFEKMEPGDLVIFHQNGEYIGVALIGTTFIDEENWAGTTFWEGSPSNRIFTLEDFRAVSVPKSVVNHLFGYSDEYSPQGLMRVAPKRVDRRPEVIKRAFEKYTERDG